MLSYTTATAKCRKGGRIGKTKNRRKKEEMGGKSANRRIRRFEGS
jgi:hypothetical protein